MLRRHATLATIAAVLATIPATAVQSQGVKPGEEHGLGLTGPEVPEALKEAQANPYALPPRVDCATLNQHISDLDHVLGPDVDAPQVKTEKSKTDDLMAGVRAVVPYGGVVRTLTGAGKKEKALVNAALAAWERRGYLKGLAHSRGCRVGSMAAPAAAVATVSAPPAAAPAPKPPVKKPPAKKKSQPR